MARLSILANGHEPMSRVKNPKAFGKAACRNERHSELRAFAYFEGADEARDHDCEVQLPADYLQRGNASREFRTGQEVAVTQRRQRDETIIGSAGLRKRTRPCKAAWRAEFDS